MREVTDRQLKLEQKLDLLRKEYNNVNSELTDTQRRELWSEIREAELEYQRRYNVSYAGRVIRE